MKTPKVRARGDGGFTLIEVLVTLVITGFIIAALGEAITVALADTTGTSLRLSESHDADLSARYFAGDVSAVDVSAWASGRTITASTKTISCTTATTQVLSLPLAWETTTSNGSQATPTTTTGTSVWTLKTTPSNASRCQLVRTLTMTGLTTSAVTVARNVISVNAPACAPNCTDPDTISMTVNDIADPVHPTPAFSYTLSWTVRHTGAGLNAGSQPVLPTMAFPYLLALNPTGIGVNIGGNGSFEVDTMNQGAGDSIVNSSSTGAITLGANATYSTASPGDVYSPGTCTASGNSRCPTVTKSSAVPDPLAALPAPAQPAAFVKKGDCGYYSAALTITGSLELNPTNATDCVVYLAAGFSASGNAVVTSGSNGEMIYVAGGSFTLAGNATVSLTGIQDAANTYYGMQVFQARNDATALSISGNGTASVYNGIVYAPDAAVDIAGNGGVTVGPNQGGSCAPSTPAALITTQLVVTGNGDDYLS